ncbi:hypothetical protein RIR_jg356.t1 [Rhizophagus irregularis DAOM 181602=DAOM 197198]|nr:hypothetical protein RIR_jg356.t1 [Rhizophagus irregularis DAOM 181602=DAOM 197198]
MMAYQVISYHGISFWTPFQTTSGLHWTPFQTNDFWTFLNAISDRFQAFLYAILDWFQQATLLFPGFLRHYFRPIPDLLDAILNWQVKKKYFK